MSVDIVNVIPIQKYWLKEIVKIFPGYDSKKLKFLEEENFFSCRDGIISKEGAWRLSWSNSEVRLFFQCKTSMAWFISNLPHENHVNPRIQLLD